MTKLISITSVVAGGLLAASGAFAAGPTISGVSPATATSNVPQTFTATVNSGSGIQSCNLYVDLEDRGAMTVSGNTVSKSYTFTSGGSRIAFVFCRDNSGGMASGPYTSIWVEGAIVGQPPLTQPTPPVVTPPTSTPPVVTPPSALTRKLVKLVCPEGAASDNPCKAVYYVGADGKRHAFPNEKTFFTWYQNFDGVSELSANDLAALPLGANATYRPGVKMVKFTTDNKVYAVSANGVLRWVKTEEIARTLYGTDWNKLIDDVADTFYTNYTFGSDLNVVADFNPTAEMAQKLTID